MKSQPEDVKGEVLESPITEVGSPNTMPEVQRSKRPARCYFMTMAVNYLVLLIVAVITLASFEIKESEIRRLKNSLVLVKLIEMHTTITTQTCILFAPHEDVLDNRYRVISALMPHGLCVFVLWGLISISIVALVWLIYNVVLAAIGPKM